MVRVRATPFVGRVDELAELRRSVERALRGSGPGAVFVFGPPGAGKSRVLAEACGNLSGRQVVSVNGYAVEASVPLAAAASVVREVLPKTVGRDRLQVFEATDRWLAGRGPRVVAVDDLQWVDEDSRALLHYLIRGAASRRDPVAVLMGSREDPGSRAFAAQVRSLLGDDGYREVELGPLSPSESAAMVADLVADETLDHAAIHRLSGGWPFWVELCCRRPDDRERTLARWLSEADADAWAVLGVLAVAGRPLSADAVAAIIRWPRLRALAAMDATRSRGWTAPEHGAEGIVHDLLRDAVLERRASPELARLHGMVARQLERVAGDDVHTLLEAVGHRASAGSVSLGLIRRVLDSPGHRLLRAEDIERLWKLVSSHAREHGPDVGTLLFRLARATSEVAEPTAALERWVSAAAMVSEGRDRARAWLEAARVATALEDPDTAEALLARARTVPSPDEALCVLWDAQAASIELLRGQLVAGAATSARALRRARQLRPDHTATGGKGFTVEARLRALAVAGDAARLLGDPTAMVEVGTEMTEVAAGQDHDANLRGLRDAGFGLLMLGRPAEAEVHLRTAYASAHADGRPLATLDAGFWLVLLLHTRGQLQLARAVIGECLALARRLDDGSRSVENVQVADHLVALSDRDWHVAADGLRAHLDGEADVHARIRVAYWLTSALSRLAPETSVDEVAGRIEQASVDAQAAACQRCADEFALRAADALARCGAPEQATVWTGRCDPDRMPADAYLAWWYVRARASIAVAAGKPDSGRLLAATSRLAAENGFALEAWWAELDLARGSADEQTSVTRLEQVRQRAGAMGAATEARLAEQALRARGVRAWRRSAAGPRDGDTVLTPRELEVADLVAVGASNREVAERLFLSPKTVESHLSHIFTKLDVRNRAELAALVTATALADDGNVREPPDEPRKARP